MPNLRLHGNKRKTLITSVLVNGTKNKYRSFSNESIQASWKKRMSRLRKRVLGLEDNVFFISVVQRILSRHVFN